MGDASAKDHRLSAEAENFLTAVRPVSQSDFTEAGISDLRQQSRNIYGAAGLTIARSLGLKLGTIKFGGMEALVASPEDSPLGIFYLFGGGYVSGDPESDLSISATLAANLNLGVVSPRYRLAPEHPYPAAVDDAFSAYRSFVDTVKYPFYVVGESAGGGLALAMLLKARDSGLPLPSAVALLSPWVDLTGSLERAEDGRDPTLTEERLMAYARLYLGSDGNPSVASASPLFGDLSALPPVIISTGGRDILRRQAYALDQRLYAAGGKSELLDWPGLWHVFEFYAELPEAAASLQRIASRLRSL